MLVVNIDYIFYLCYMVVQGGRCRIQVDTAGGVCWTQWCCHGTLLCSRLLGLLSRVCCYGPSVSELTRADMVQ
jgi:hypothetical protein